MNFDVAMPLTLFSVTVASMLLNEKVEKKMRSAFEEKEFRTRDIISLVVAMSAMVSVMVLIPRMAIMIVFLFAYSILLFMFTYLFSNLKKTNARIFCISFLILSFLIATLSLMNFGANSTVAYGALALCCLFAFTFVALLHEENRTDAKERWYLAVMPPALFAFLYMFFNRTPIWFPYLLDLYGVIFAVLITLYLGSLFTWKTSLIFVGLLTIMDIILVLFTGSMVSAARHVSSLQLPMLIVARTVPGVIIKGNLVWMSLGLGDFFFAGLLAIQTLKKFNKSFAITSVIAMSTSFFVFETLMLNYEPRAFPGTLMIICGWLPLVAWKALKSKKRIRQNLL